MESFWERIKKIFFGLFLKDTVYSLNEEIKDKKIYDFLENISKLVISVENSTNAFEFHQRVISLRSNLLKFPKTKKSEVYEKIGAICRRNEEKLKKFEEWFKSGELPPKKMVIQTLVNLEREIGLENIIRKKAA